MNTQDTLDRIRRETNEAIEQFKAVYGEDIIERIRENKNNRI